MDFLDPLRRQRHRTRLLISYVFLGLALAGGTILLVMAANGYGINPRTGDIIRNGLVFIDSRPSGATVRLNYIVESDKTSSRLLLPAGKYKLQLSRDGYQTWTNDFNLKLDDVIRFNYPLLLPRSIEQEPIHSYPAKPGFISASPNRRWLLIGGAVSSDGRTTIDQFELKAGSPRTRLELPDNLLRSHSGSLKVVEWAEDNENLLLKHQFNGRSQYLLFNRRDPARSYNVNDFFRIDPERATFNGDRSDELLLYRSGNLWLADKEKRPLGSALLSGLTDFTDVDRSLLLYAKTISGHLSIRISTDGRRYQLARLSTVDQPLLAGSDYNGGRYLSLVSRQHSRLAVWQVDTGSDGKISAKKVMSLRQENIEQMKFSSSGRFLLVRAGQQVAVYDFELQKLLRYRLKAEQSPRLGWLDDYHLAAVSLQRLWMMDYDGQNQRQLPYSLYGSPVLAPDYQRLWLLRAPAEGLHSWLSSLELLAPADR
ncbi:PEGA domain-containing protein [Candidatus Saccharibacteria bacterium]|nr:PEGA domain-containing protein [Candidatus Saccharibacteria bacterium]